MKNKSIFFIVLILTLFCLASCNKDEVKHIHAFSQWETVREATCTDEGLMKRSCIDCGKKQEHTVQKLAHTLTSQVSEPACDKEGYTTYSCRCGYSYVTEQVKPLGHKLAMTVKAPTCTEQGYTHNLCESCGYEFNSDFVKPLEHKSSTAERHYATLRSSGYTVYTCQDCEHTYMADYISYSDIVTGATVENTEVLQKGIDTSKWNHKTGLTSNDLLPIDWEGLKEAGVEFVILRAGTSLGKDPAFEADYIGAKAAGLEVGAYFYAYSTTVGGTVADALMLVEWLKGKQFEYPIYFDVEDDTLLGLTGAHLTEMCVAFGEVLQTHGYYAAIYANNEWLYKILDTEQIKTLFDVWYARYNLDIKDDETQSFEFGAKGFEWDKELFGDQMGMWQYTEKGVIEGFEGKFDLNYAYKDYFSIMKKWGLNGF